MNNKNQEPDERQADPEQIHDSSPGEAGKRAEAEETPSAPREDKFMQFTRKMTSSAEKVISTSYMKTRNTVKSYKFESRASVRKLDDFLKWAKTVFPAEKFEACAAWCVKYGHAGLLAAQILTVIFGIAAAVRLANWLYFLYGIGIAVLLAVLQYTAHKFLNAGDSLISASPSSMASEAVLDCLALLTEIAGILLFIGFLVKAREIGQWSLFWVGLGAWALCDAVAYIALHPSMTNISISSDVRAGEEAIGIMSFLVKAIVRTVPIAFGIGAVLGAVGLLFATFSLMRTGQLIAGAAAIRLIILCTCLPFASYLVFAFYHLILDILRAILVLPRKIDQATSRTEN